MSLRLWTERAPVGALGAAIERLEAEGIVARVTEPAPCDVALVERLDAVPSIPPRLGILVCASLGEPSSGPNWMLADARSHEQPFSVRFVATDGSGVVAVIGGRTVIPPERTAAGSILAGRLAVAVMRALRQVATAEAGALGEAFAAAPRLPLGDPRASLRPSALSPRRARLADLLTRAGRRIGRTTRELQWQLRVAPSSDVSQLMTAEVQSLIPPRGTIWADPFLVEHGGETWLLAEELRGPQGKGTIVGWRRDADGGWGSPQPVLQFPWHLSYPQPLHHEGALYLIPEMSEARAVKAYRCERMPDRWSEAATLVAGEALLDATLVQHGDRWWMFATKAGELGESPYEDLHVYYADSPLSSHWTPHPWNPVLSDVRCGRGAGPLFTDDRGRLLRPAQDCSRRYGGGLTLSEITRLTPTRFESRIVEQSHPDGRDGLVGTHHYSSCGNLHVIDVEVAIS